MYWNDLYRDLNTISVEGREGRCCGCNNGHCESLNFHDFPAYISFPIRNPFNTNTSSENTTSCGRCGSCGNGY